MILLHGKASLRTLTTRTGKICVSFLFYARLSCYIHASRSSYPLPPTRKQGGFPEEGCRSHIISVAAFHTVHQLVNIEAERIVRHSKKLEDT